MNSLGIIVTGVVVMLIGKWLLGRIERRGPIGSFLKLVEKAAGWIRHVLSGRGVTKITATGHELLQWLKEDQSTSGNHMGEFGVHRDAKEASPYATKYEPLTSIKPRLWDTAWACRVLSAHGLCEDQINLAATGIDRLLNTKGQFIIPDMISAYSNPTARKFMVSRRHTIRIADILLHIDRKPERVKKILSYMLDPSSDWQDQSGGWSPYDRIHTAPDLWTTVYAINVLHTFIQKSIEQTKKELKKLAIESLSRSIDWLEKNWEADGWRDEATPAQQNLTQVISEIAPALLKHRQSIVVLSLDTLRHCLTPIGTLRQDYLNRLKQVSSEAAALRHAFALCQLGADQSEWKPLLSDAVHQWKNTLSPPDIAMLFHLLIIINAKTPTHTVI